MWPAISRSRPGFFRSFFLFSFQVASVAVFQQNRIGLFGYATLAILNPSGFTTGVQALSNDELPATYVYVKEDNQKVAIKRSGDAEWIEADRFARLFPGDSLKIPTQVKILMSDGSSIWKEVTGPSVMGIQKKEKNDNRLTEFIKNLESMFLKEPHRQFSREGVRNTETLLLAMRDTVIAFAFPDTLHWIKNAPWWTTYRVQITRNHETLLDTLVKSTALRLSAKRWLQSGDYQIKVTLPQSPLLGTEVDSSVVHVLQRSQVTPVKSQFEKLKRRTEQKGRIEDYFELITFCLGERLGLELEHSLIDAAKKFPNNPEPKIMLYSYYAAFLPEQVAERLTLDHMK